MAFHGRLRYDIIFYHHYITFIMMLYEMHKITSFHLLIQWWLLEAFPGLAKVLNAKANKDRPQFPRCLKWELRDYSSKEFDKFLRSVSVLFLCIIV